MAVLIGHSWLLLQSFQYEESAMSVLRSSMLSIQACVVTWSESPPVEKATGL